MDTASDRRRKSGKFFHQRSILQVSANPKNWCLNHAKTGKGRGFCRHQHFVTKHFSSRL
jgi:hypothetical protein